VSWVRQAGVPWVEQDRQNALRKRQVWGSSHSLRDRQEVAPDAPLPLLATVAGTQEALLIASGQNLKRLLQRSGWGGRPFPSGSADSGWFCVLRWLLGSLPKGQSDPRCWLVDLSAWIHG
jgi:hypothetical protein